MQILRLAQRRLRVVGEQRRDFERDPAIDAGSALVNRTKQIRGPRDVLQRDLEEQLLARLAGSRLRADRRVVGRAVLDRLIEDRRVRSEPGDRQLVDVALRACRSSAARA